MKEVHHLRALQAFDTAANHSSLSRAAESLGVTHSAVSRQIKQLETYLGVHLLHRRPNGVEKTDVSFPPKTGPLFWPRKGDGRWLGSGTLTRIS